MIPATRILACEARCRWSPECIQDFSIQLSIPCRSYSRCGCQFDILLSPSLTIESLCTASYSQSMHSAFAGRSRSSGSDPSTGFHDCRSTFREEASSCLAKATKTGACQLGQYSLCTHVRDLSQLDAVAALMAFCTVIWNP